MSRDRMFVDPTTNERIPVEDATVPLLVHPLEQDIQNAKPGDPFNCIFALSLRRMFGVNNVYIFRSVAYVEMRNEHGKKIMQRYKLGTTAQRYTEEFDNSKNAFCGGFYLSPPPYSETLDGKAEYDTDKKRRAAKLRKARAAKTAPRTTTRTTVAIRGRSTKSTQQKSRPVAYFRSGLGMVHFDAKNTDVIQKRAA